MQKSTEDMTINELMVYYLENSQVANGGSTTAAPGSQTTVFVETEGGEGFTEQVKAKAWGHLRSEPAVVLKLFGGHCYALSHGTYREICSLLSRDLSDCEVPGLYRLSSGGPPGTLVYVNPEGQATISATAWYEISSGGLLRLFRVDGKLYAISLVAPKTISVRTLTERRTGSFANPDPRRQIIWHDFDVSKGGVAEPNFPRKPGFLL